MTFTQKGRTVPLRKKSLKIWQPHNIRSMNEIKGNKEVYSFRENEGALCDSHTKLSGIGPLEN